MSQSGTHKSRILPFPAGQRARKTKARRITFSRTELMALLGLYTTRVMAGDWRDYAISDGPGMAQFCMFKSAYEMPLFTVAKVQQPGKNGGGCQFFLFKGQEKIRKAEHLADVLEALRAQIPSLSAIS